MSEMSGRTAECWHTGQISTKSGKSLMNAFLRARTAFGFEYLISFRAEHNDADRYYGNRRTSFPKSTKWRRDNRLEDSKLAK